MIVNRDDIARLAYHFWELEGCPNGKHEEHWLRAVRLHESWRDTVLRRTGPAAKVRFEEERAAAASAEPKRVRRPAKPKDHAR